MFKLQLATVLCFALASVPSFAQGISSSTCYGFGGTSCTAYVFGTYKALSLVIALLYALIVGM